MTAFEDARNDDELEDAELPPETGERSDTGPALAALGPLLEQLAEEPWGIGFFHLLRRIDAATPEFPAIGSSESLGREFPLRFGQDVSLRTISAPLSSFAPPGAQNAGRLGQRFFGLLGPEGPLPIFLTEAVVRRSKSSDQETSLHDFADIFHHRLLSLLYRAWRLGSPAASADREDDPISRFVAALCGRLGDHLAGLGPIGRTLAVGFAGHFGCDSRHPDGLESALTDLVQHPVRIEEFIGEWLQLPREARCRLGAPGEHNRLGSSPALGHATWSCQHKFRVHVGPLHFDRYAELLPGGNTLDGLVEVVQEYVGEELTFDVDLTLLAEEAPPLVLDASRQLGRTSFLCGASRTPVHRLRVDAPPLRRTSLMSARQ
ncbi:MAG: type VI secretion system baseplate subunit TssG [Planctomycetes bacterium]|nr:type VI secretion system baseplate subunit TssG [Planctomycetota bacterium]